MLLNMLLKQLQLLLLLLRSTDKSGQQLQSSTDNKGQQLQHKEQQTQSSVYRTEQQLLLQGQASAAIHQTLPTLLERVVDPLHFPLMVPHGDTGWHLQIAHAQNPTPNPDLVSAQQQQSFSALQHEMRAEQQQQQPRANQPSALQIVKQQMHHLKELHPSKLEQQHDSGSKNQHEPDSESDDGRGMEDRCVAADFAICRYVTTAILQALTFQRLNLWRLQELRRRGQW